jgi:serine protease DegQ
MKRTPDCSTSGRRAAIHLGAALTLGLALVVTPAHAGVPLPLVAEMARAPSLAAVVKEIAPSVVGIETSRGAPERTVRNPGSLRQVGEEARTPGSGVVFDADRGLIITNSHVIDRADRIIVRLTDGRALPARRVGADRNTDVAVIKVDAAGLTEAVFADSDGLEVGDFVLAIGHPPPLGQTVSAGIVSSIGFVGVSNGNPGFGFAIPARLARTLAMRIVAGGDIRRGMVGLVYEDSAMTIVADLKMSAPPLGALILEVDTGSPAARAGFKPGDLVTEIGGTPVRDALDLRRRIALLEIGDVAEFGVSRRGSSLTLRAAIAGAGRTK